MFFLKKRKNSQLILEEERLDIRTILNTCFKDSYEENENGRLVKEPISNSIVTNKEVIQVSDIEENPNFEENTIASVEDEISNLPEGAINIVTNDADWDIKEFSVIEDKNEFSVETTPNSKSALDLLDETKTGEEFFNKLMENKNNYL